MELVHSVTPVQVQVPGQVLVPLAATLRRVVKTLTVTIAWQTF